MVPISVDVTIFYALVRRQEVCNPVKNLKDKRKQFTVGKIQQLSLT